MSIAVVTRTRITRPRPVAAFASASLRVALDARRSAGFVSGALRITAGPEFWTLTLWEDGRSLHAWATGRVHASAMPRMAGWASDASTSAWPVASRRLPTWQEAESRLLAAPRFTDLDVPSDDHRSGVERPMPRRGLTMPLPAARGI